MSSTILGLCQVFSIIRHLTQNEKCDIVVLTLNPRELVPLVLTTPLNTVVVSDAAGLSTLQTFLEQHTVIGWDVETNVVNNYHWRRCRTIQFGTAEQQFLIDLKAFEPNLQDFQGEYGKNLQWSYGLRQVLAVIVPFLTDRNKLKVGVNLGFEYQVMYWCFGVRCQGFFDCSLVERII